MRITTCSSLLVLVAQVAQGQELVLNEVLYDPPGPDRGFEFVELYNPSSQAVDLQGLRLEFVNGADPTSPSAVWSGGGLQIAAGAFYLIAGSELSSRDALLEGSLQNGPDALWLWRGERIIDRLAWGELDDLGEGPSAVDVASASLGRKPDGHDTDDNSRDWFVFHEPTPGAPNSRGQRIRPLSLTIDPPWRSEAGELKLELIAIADGVESPQEAVLSWWLDGRLEAEAMLRADAGDSLRNELRVWLTSGRHHISVYSSSVAQPPDSLARGIQLGTGEVILNEVMAAPPPGEPEWIELRGIGDRAIDLRGWAISDATRRSSPIGNEALLGVGDFLLLTPDAPGLRASRSLPVGAVVLEPDGGWPTLNNSAAAGESADQVFLLDASGVVVDHLSYDETLLGERGQSMERGQVAAGASTGWFASPGDPTPGLPNAAAAAPLPRSGLSVHPNPFSPDGDGDADVLHVLLRRPPEEASIVAEVFDLTGETVRVLGAGRSGSGVLQWLWDGRDGSGRAVPMGAYVVVVRSGGRQAESARWRSLVALGRRP